MKKDENDDSILAIAVILAIFMLIDFILKLL